MFLFYFKRAELRVFYFSLWNQFFMPFYKNTKYIFVFLLTYLYSCIIFWIYFFLNSVEHLIVLMYVPFLIVRSLSPYHLLLNTNIVYLFLYQSLSLFTYQNILRANSEKYI